MREGSKYELDTVDIMIAQELARDGRTPIMRLAANTGISQRAAHSRLHRLTSEGIIKVMAVPIWQFTESTIEASVGFNVKSGHSVNAVAEKLAEYPSICVVALATGPYDIITWAIFDKLEALSTFLRHDIGSISGIESHETLIHLETVTNILTYPISEINQDSYTPMRHRERKQVHQIDNLDMVMIKELQKDGRMTVVDLAGKLGLSRASTAKRLQRLLSEGIVSIIAITEPGTLGYEVTGRIGINVFPGTVDNVAQKLASFSAVHFVAITVGRYDILIGVHFSELHELSGFKKDGLNTIPDIAKSENMVYLELIKSPFEFVADFNHYL
ncbi:Lrp/AsnC family transcriptional regulator [Chloroflexota bacterium]